MKQEMVIEFRGGKKVTALYNGFAIETDQAVESGGEASAPEPYDLFLASLGTCAGYYVVAFCKGRELPTEGIRLVQSWTRDEKRKLVGVALAIEVPESFPSKYHKALIRSANLCSVKKVLESPPTVESRVVVVS